MKGWRTLAVNIAVGVFAALEMTDLTGVVPDEHLPAVLLCVTLANVVLRVITTTPVGRRA